MWIRLAGHRTKPGTAIQCKTKDSSRVLSGIRAAQFSVFCTVFCGPLFIILSFFVWPLHCLPFFNIWLPITLFASTNYSYLLTYTRTTTGADPGGGGTRRAPPLKLEKIWFFGVKSWFFTRNTPTIFAPPSARRDFFKCGPP
jgi:hypothetical protein